MRRSFFSTGEWEVEMMNDPGLEGVSEEEAAQWLGVSIEELHRFIDEGTLNVSDVYHKGELLKSAVRTMDIRNLLAKRRRS